MIKPEMIQAYVDGLSHILSHFIEPLVRQIEEEVSGDRKSAAMRHLNHLAERRCRSEGESSHASQLVLCKRLNTHADPIVTRRELFTEEIQQERLAFHEVGCAQGRIAFSGGTAESGVVRYKE